MNCLLDKLNYNLNFQGEDNGGRGYTDLMGFT